MQTETIITNGLPAHGSPQDRGSADRYYGREFNPHYWPEGTSMGKSVELADMTVKEIVAYTHGFNNETDRKDWGQFCYGWHKGVYYG